MSAFDPTFAWIVRLALALLFAVSCAHKLRDFPRFVATLRDYRVLPAALAAPAAILVLAAEGATAAALLVPPLQQAAGGGALMLLALYSAAIGANLVRGRRHIDCGCLGPARRQPLSGWLLARNALLGLGALSLLADTTARALTWIDLLSVAASVCVAALVWNAANALATAPPRTTPESTT